MNRGSDEKDEKDPKEEKYGAVRRAAHRATNKNGRGVSDRCRVDMDLWSHGNALEGPQIGVGLLEARRTTRIDY
jgi:hypothetical protein